MTPSIRLSAFISLLKRTLLLLPLYCSSVLANTNDGPYVCTLDINVWGNPSQCQCPENRVYNEITGLCMTPQASDSLGRQGSYPSSICTKDLGIWGSPSHCVCPDDRDYSEKSAACLTRVSPNIITRQGKLVFTQIDQDIRFAEAKLVTPAGAEYWLNFNNNDQHALNLNGLWVEVTGEVVYLRSGSLNAPPGTLITVDTIYWLE